MSKKRYSLPNGKAFRPFGLGLVITNDNITDEMVENLLKTNPDAAKVFIDAEAAPEGESEPGDGLDALTKKELHAKYVELSGKAADEKLNKEALLALVRDEVAAKALLG